MMFGLYQDQSERLLSGLRTVSRPEPGIWDNFASGTGMAAMRTFASVGARAATMAAGGVASLVERFGEGHPLQPVLDTRMSDAIFKFHDDVTQRAVEYWTPKPQEVGAAGEVAGTLLATLPMVMAAPLATVAGTQLAQGEELARKGVDTARAVAVGAVQGAGLGLGIWMPMLGANGWQRMVVGGAGFNVAQGVATRGLSGKILEGTAAAKDFEAFDWSQVTLDALLGLAFGGLAHLSPAQRAQGEAAWDSIRSWTGRMKPSDEAALVTLRAGEHLAVDTAPGKLVGLEDIEAHANRMRTAIEQLARDQPVQVDGLPAPKFTPDPARSSGDAEVARVMVEEAKALAKAEGVDLDAAPARPQAEPLPAQDTPAPRADAETQDGQAPAPVDPLASEALRFADQHPDVLLTMGAEADGTPVQKTLRQYLDESDATVRQAQQDAKLFEVAAACMLGVG